MQRRLLFTLGIIFVFVIGFIFLLNVLQKVEYKYPIESQDETIAYKTQRITDNNLWEGEEKKAREGEEGIKTHFTYFEEKYVNDKQEYRKEINPIGKPKEKVTKKPTTELIRYGTKKGYSTGYIWKIHEESSIGTYFCDFEISVEKLLLEENNLVVYVKFKNLPGTILQEYNYGPVGGFRLHLGDYSVSCDYPQPGKENEIKVEAPWVSIWPKEYRLGLDAEERMKEISLDKFWVGTIPK